MFRRHELLLNATFQLYNENESFHFTSDVSLVENSMDYSSSAPSTTNFSSHFPEAVVACQQTPWRFGDRQPPSLIKNFNVKAGNSKDVNGGGGDDQ